jgi:hypothetical protein
MEVSSALEEPKNERENEVPTVLNLKVKSIQGPSVESCLSLATTASQIQNDIQRRPVERSGSTAGSESNAGEGWLRGVHVPPRLGKGRDRGRRYRNLRVDVGKSKRKHSGLLSPLSGCTSAPLPLHIVEQANARLEDAGLEAYADVNSRFESSYDVLCSLGEVRPPLKL